MASGTRRIVSVLPYGVFYDPEWHEGEVRKKEDKNCVKQLLVGAEAFPRLNHVIRMSQIIPSSFWAIQGSARLKNGVPIVIEFVGEAADRSCA